MNAYSHVLGRESDLLQYLLGAGTAEILPPGLEQQLVRLRQVQQLMLPQHPPALVHEQAQGMIQRLEGVLAPATVARMPEPGQEGGTEGNLVVRLWGAGHHHHPVNSTRPIGMDRIGGGFEYSSRLRTVG